jgi:signal transduction histidine kinase
MSAEPVMGEQLRAITYLQNLSLRLNVSLSLDEILDAIIEAAMAICRADRAAISYLNSNGELLIMRHRGLSEEYLKRRSLTHLDPALAKAISTREPLIIEDVEEMASASSNYPAWKSEGIASIVTLPLVSEGETFGVLGAGSSAVRRYSQTELNAMAILAAQASAAITNARLYEQLSEANRAKDEFLSTLSHELRTPLTPILGWMHLLKPYSTLNLTLTEGLDAVERNANQLAGLINDLLDVTRIISGKIKLDRTLTDLKSLVGRISAQAIRLVQRRAINIELNLPSEAITIVADPVRIEQAISNLMSNAVKFTPDGGRILVSLSRDQGEALIEVRDTGIGIEPEFLPRVFERFSQAHSGINRRYGGLGLGLAIAREMVEMHGGKMTAESEGWGRGSAFTIRLPLTKAGADSSASKNAGRESAPQSEEVKIEPLGLRVLVIEDSRDTLDMLRLWLEAFGCEVLTATDAVEGERAALENLPDLIISDIGLPGVDGHEFRQSLSLAMLAMKTATWPKMPVTTLT